MYNSILKLTEFWAFVWVTLSKVTGPNYLRLFSKSEKPVLLLRTVILFRIFRQIYVETRLNSQWNMQNPEKSTHID